MHPDGPIGKRTMRNEAKDIVDTPTLDRRRVLLIPSLYDADWSIRTNEALALHFLTPFEDVTHSSWSRYHVQQYALMRKTASWLEKSWRSIDALFYTNIFKDFSYALFLRYPSLKFLGLAHGSSADPLEPGSSVVAFQFEKAVSMAARICCTSNHLASKLLESGINGSSLVVTGLPLSGAYDAGRDRDGALCVYNHRVVPEKGVGQFSDLWRRVLERDRTAGCAVTWPSASEEGLIQLHSIKQLPGVQLVGTLQREEYYKLLSRASVGLSLSRYENFGTSYAYALQCGVCYFVPDSLAFRETAIARLRYSTLDDLADMIIRALANREWRQELVAEGQAHLRQEYSPESFLRRCGVE